MPETPFWNVLFVKQWEFFFPVLTSFSMRRVFISPLSHIQLGSQSNQWTPAVLCLQSMCIYYYFRLWNCPWCWNHGGVWNVVVRWSFYRSKPHRWQEVILYQDATQKSSGYWNILVKKRKSNCLAPDKFSILTSLHRQHVNSSLTVFCAKFSTQVCFLELLH